MLESAMRDEADGNWDDGDAAKEMGFKEGPEMKLGGTVDMDDDIYMEFEEEEDEVKKDLEPASKVYGQFQTKY
jgi:hypothetical protein